MNKARRYNKGKTRFALMSPFALKCIAEVYTKGAHKYSIYLDSEGKEVLGKDIPLDEVSKYKLIDDASDNWRKGMSWMETMDSIERHLHAWYSGEDIDPELGTYHLANAGWGIFTLLDYYKSHPMLDDRPHKYLNEPRYGLDVDDVLADFIPAWMELWGMEHKPNSWYFDYDMTERFQKMRDNNTLDDFYLQLKTKIEPKDLPFEPTAYVTSRPVPTEVTMEWLKIKGFPLKPVITVPVGSSKVDACREMGIDIFVDDSYKNFVDLNKNGICCFLFDCEHNHKYSVGHKRIKELKEVVGR
jgi:hypothetical protein